ncbi:hypothetical protein NP7_00845 [Moraxella osloensis]|uniref:Uncharacterized protein n=1 Tax=Faucicola osloensis TaxID=34062 RepID=A0A2D2LSE8_FAUOS|nr:hypothetical protein NP7_00845 [Moraxella osloensis]
MDINQSIFNYSEGFIYFCQYRNFENCKNFVVGFGLLTLQVAFYFPKKNNFGKMKWLIVSIFLTFIFLV